MYPIVIIVSYFNRCTKELNQWDHLLDYTQTKNLSNPVLILESAWRVPDWNLMKEALSQVDMAYPGILTWKVSYLFSFELSHVELTSLINRVYYIRRRTCIKDFWQYVILRILCYIWSNVTSSKPASSVSKSGENYRMLFLMCTFTFSKLLNRFLLISSGVFVRLLECNWMYFDRLSNYKKLTKFTRVCCTVAVQHHLYTILKRSWKHGGTDFRLYPTIWAIGAISSHGGSITISSSLSIITIIKISLLNSTAF